MVKLINDLDGTRITNINQKPYALSMEDKMATGVFERATNYGWYEPFKLQSTPSQQTPR